MAVRLVLAMLPQQEIVQTEDVAVACESVDKMLSGLPGGSPGLSLITRAVESRVVVWQEAAKSLHDAKGHIEWLPEAKATRGWEFWNRYRRYMTEVADLPIQVVWRTGETTDDILQKLEDPLRTGPWDRRGLVVGEVQSGKTANYLGLICKAADAGYKLIVVLTGMHNSLRSQTQLRVDEGLLGFDTQYQQRYDEEKSGSSRIGVGAMPGAARLKVASLTTSAEKGDFKKAVAGNMALPIGDYPVALVIKKHRSIIDNVRKWVTEVEGEQKAGTDDKIVPAGIPLLVIDDEADQASVNTKAINDPEADPTKVNAAIRELLNSFQQSAYVGYTATPYANIYADPGSTGHKKYGQDIFPRSFIESLRAPSNHFGPTRVFGLRSPDPLEPDVEALPIFRKVEDQDAWLPDGHKAGTTPGPLPKSLLAALNAFVLVSAARRARGQGTKHSSMLIHATAWVDVQVRVVDQVRDEIQFLRDRVRTDGAKASADVWTELRDLWEHDFVTTSSSFPDETFDILGWDEVRREVGPALEKLTFKTINGSSKDALDYYENRRNGLVVIAVGGNKLSRGLTLEGLSVSYYLRASKMYDTLLQMGRWFGYRPGYEDLCRLYTTESLRLAYREITGANEELRRDLEEMAVQGLTPEHYGLRVRNSVNGLLVTAPSKSRRAQKIKLSFSGDLSETSIYDITAKSLSTNWQSLEAFVRRLDQTGKPETRRTSGSLVWSDVPPDLVADEFLTPYVADQMAQRVRPTFMADYVRHCAAVGELGSWTVMLVGTSGGDPVSIGGQRVGLVTRERQQLTDRRYTIRRVLNPADESVDLSEDQARTGLENLKKSLRPRYEAEGKLEKLDKLKVPSGPYLRRQRRTDQALLIIYPLARPRPDLAYDVVGFAVSFPYSEQTIELPGEYVVNEVWLQAGFDEEDLPE